eukprot:Transcript_32505.p1 GENE.Transcript_32505~~Transcript_32505.p1  ORF type:complete len:875 (-),score=384.70 Transcript_32505:50-2674(-)
MLIHLVALGAGGPWDRIGPWNIFDDKRTPPQGEAGTLANAASPRSKPHIIYAGGQNNGVSSGIIKTVDGGVHWTRNSKGLWDTRISGVWIHPDDDDYIFAGTHSGVYESTDGAASWALREETAGWGDVMSFREGVIQGQPYILANSQNGILTLPRAGGTWQRIATPKNGGIASNAHLSVAVHDGTTEVLTCIGGWGGGQLWYAAIDSPSNATWSGPLATQNVTYPHWDFFPGTSQIWGKCKTPTSCDPDVHPLGVFDDLASCQAAVNATTAFKVASYTYQHKGVGGGYDGRCYAISSYDFDPHPQPKVDSGRAPGLFPGTPLDCANVAVDPKDRDHFLFSKGGQYRAWESRDGGKTVHELKAHPTASYFVMIDTKNSSWYYTATQAGAFVSNNSGKTWSAYHVVVHSRSGKTIDRVPHDYQRIVPDFRGDGIAFPSDQGLHIANKSGEQFVPNLISAVGDMRNTMSLSALIAPSTTKPGSRNLVVNIWDWDVAASWDDGATWAAWAPGEKSPGACGEGGGGIGMGKSGKMIMFHHNHWWFSADGGHNFKMGNLPAGGGSFDYVRLPGSRSEPAGQAFALMNAPDPLPPSAAPRKEGAGKEADDDDDDDRPEDNHNDNPDDDDGDDDDAPGRGLDYTPLPEDEEEHDKEIGEMDPGRSRYVYSPGLREVPAGTKAYLLTSTDHGNNWTWALLPDSLQAGGLAVDPTTPDSLFALTASCLAHSADQGQTWSACSTAAGLTGKLSKLLVKDSRTMFMLRSGAVPLRTTDGGGSWQELASAAPLFAHGATMDGSLSWSGKTLVLTGADLSAIGRGEYATAVWKSTNDGDDWTDETGDLVTISPGPGVWYEQDFYFVTRGEGVTVKRNFEAGDAALVEK